MARIKIGTSAHIELTDGAFATIDCLDFPKIKGIVWRSVLRHKTRYAIGTLAGRKTVYMHRLLFGQDGLDTDHINGNGLDNRSENIRCVPHHINMHNNRKRKAAQDSRGVFWHPPLGKWKATMTWKGKGLHLGYFDSKEEARASRAEKEKELGVFISPDSPSQR